MTTQIQEIFPEYRWGVTEISKRVVPPGGRHSLAADMPERVAGLVQARVLDQGVSG
ncbi:MAG: hypothetical protein G8345_18715 [Magnetococcales bacterium]|nr:hypothetical protein [Magnetococcales bacterium]